MTQTEKWMKPYQAKVSQVLRMYVRQYFETYPEKRTLETACFFLNANHEIYIKELTDIFVGHMVKACPDVDFKFAMLEGISRSMGLLFSEIMLESMDGINLQLRESRSLPEIVF